MGNCRWSYFNVLEMFLAGMPPGRYTPDFGRWAKVIKDLKDKYSDVYPGILDDIYFVELEPLNPYSEELEEFFQRIGATVFNPNYDIMDIDETKILRLRSRAQKHLNQKQIEIITKMSAEVADLLKP